MSEPTPEEEGRIREVAADGKLRALVHGLGPDGSFSFLELRSELASEHGAAAGEGARLRWSPRTPPDLAASSAVEHT